MTKGFTEARIEGWDVLSGDGRVLCLSSAGPFAWVESVL